MIWNNIYPAEAHKLKQFRKVALKSEEVGPPWFRETSHHFGATCKPATVSKEYRSTKSLENSVLNNIKCNNKMATILDKNKNNENNFFYLKIS